MTKEIKLKRKDLAIPDGTLKLHVKYLDIANPLLDSDGNPIQTSELGTDGSPVYEYPEYSIDIDIPDEAAASTEAITALIAEALEDAKIKAQTRANKEERKALLKPFVDALAELNPVEFEGTVDLTELVLE